MSSSYCSVDNVLLNRYDVDPAALSELDDISILDEMEQMLYGPAGCTPAPLNMREIPRVIKERLGLK